MAKTTNPMNLMKEKHIMFRKTNFLATAVAALGLLIGASLASHAQMTNVVNAVLNTSFDGKPYLFAVRACTYNGKPSGYLGVKNHTYAQSANISELQFQSSNQACVSAPIVYNDKHAWMKITVGYNGRQAMAGLMITDASDGSTLFSIPYGPAKGHLVLRPASVSSDRR